MNNSDAKNVRCYSQEDVQQILHLAIARQAEDKEFSYQELREIAEDLEISPEMLQLAEGEWLDQQKDIVKRQAFNKYRRGRLKKHAGRYVIINSFFVGLDLLTSHHFTWSPYISLFWGAGLGLNTWNTMQSQGEDYEKAYQRWHRQHQLKQTFNSLVTKFLKAIS